MKAAGFEDFEFSLHGDVFSGAAQESSSAAFGTLGASYRGLKLTVEPGSQRTEAEKGLVPLGLAPWPSSVGTRGVDQIAFDQGLVGP